MQPNNYHCIANAVKNVWAFVCNLSPLDDGSAIIEICQIVCKKSFVPYFDDKISNCCVKTEDELKIKKSHCQFAKRTLLNKQLESAQTHSQSELSKMALRPASVIRKGIVLTNDNRMTGRCSVSIEKSIISLQNIKTSGFQCKTPDGILTHDEVIEMRLRRSHRWKMRRKGRCDT